MARLFLAIRFNDKVKRTLVDIQNALKAKGVKGNFCPDGNLHMTLAFIGENDDLPTIQKAVSKVTFKPFSMTLDRLGTFPTKAGVIWCGVKEREPVTTLSLQLRERLEAHGIPFSSVAFYPHISLVQHPSQRVTDMEIPEATITVERVSVMKSERIHGELIYAEI